MLGRKLVCIVGPTGVGKSELAVRLAQSVGGEIVNADSRQLYRYLSIGTAKVGPEEQRSVRHYMTDVIDPDQSYNIGEYQAESWAVIRDIQSRQVVPLLVGGTGQYIWATVNGWHIPRIPPDWNLRQRLELVADQMGYKTVHQLLKHINPEAASEIDGKNVRRVIRAIEVNSNGRVGSNKTGERFENNPQFFTLIIGLTANREEIYRRVDYRVDKMLDEGLVEEVDGLMKRGYSIDIPAFKSVGYRDVAEYINGKINYKEMSDRIKTATHRLVRQQYNWFKTDDSRIHWFDVKSDYYAEVEELTSNFLQKDVEQNGFY